MEAGGVGRGEKQHDFDTQSRILIYILIWILFGYCMDIVTWSRILMLCGYCYME